MLTHFKSLIITADDIEKYNEQFKNLFGQDISRLIVDNDSKIYKHYLKNGSVELCESHDKRELFYFKKLTKYNQYNGIQALSLTSDSILDDHKNFKEMGLDISEIEEIDYNFIDKKNTNSRFFKLKKTNSFNLDLLVFEENINSEHESAFEDSTISKFNQIIIYTPKIEHLKDLFSNKLGIRLALDKVFNFGEKDIRMMFFRIGGVTLEVIENYDIKYLSYGGVGWHSENISKCHKRLTDSNFDMSEVRKGRKSGTIVSTIRNAPLLIPTIIIGLDD